MTINKPNQNFECHNFINNQWVKGSGSSFEIQSPYFGETIGVSQDSNKSDIEAITSSAKKAQVLWEQTPLKERTQVMFRFREELLKSIDNISEIVSLENGKTFAESKAGVMKGIEVLEFALSLQNLDLGGKMEVSRGVSCEYRRIPVGIVASITPFNFPAMVPMWTIPIAITLGNAYIWKPSEKTPITSLFIADALKKAGLPDGVLSIAQGGKETVLNLLESDDIQAYAFVGSSAVAKIIYEKASQKGKRVLALGGAKNHIVLLPDANPDLTGKGISDSFTGCAGQRCMAASTLLAVGDVDHHIQKIIDRAKSLKLGESMGAIITKEQVLFLKEAIAKAKAEGAKVLLDGTESASPSEYKNGFWLGPTILDNVKPNQEAATKELFGPILSIVRCKSISEAMEIENKNPYGNACSVFTSSGPLAEKVLASARAGMLGVNIGVPVPREPFSFAGINHSKFGHGDITGHHSLDFWSNIQKVTVKWEKQADENWMS